MVEVPEQLVVVIRVTSQLAVAVGPAWLWPRDIIASVCQDSTVEPRWWLRDSRDWQPTSLPEKAKPIGNPARARWVSQRSLQRSLLCNTRGQPAKPHSL